MPPAQPRSGRTRLSSSRRHDHRAASTIRAFDRAGSQPAQPGCDRSVPAGWSRRDSARQLINARARRGITTPGKVCDVPDNHAASTGSPSSALVDQRMRNPNRTELRQTDWQRARKIENAIKWPAYLGLIGRTARRFHHHVECFLVNEGRQPFEVHIWSLLEHTAIRCLAARVLRGLECGRDAGPRSLLPRRWSWSVRVLLAK